MKNKLFAMIAACFIIAGCNGGNKMERMSSDSVLAEINTDYEMAPPIPEEDKAINRSGNDNSDDQTIPNDKKKMIKDGTMSITVSDIDVTKKRVDSLLKIYNAYYSSENLYNNDYSQTYNLNIRVPAMNFELLITEIESGKGEVTSKIINARDVTVEYFDLESRLANKRSYLERYRELLRQAKTVKDILEIEEQIRSLTEEIDSAEGRLKYLSDQVAYSTLNLNITREKGYVYRPKERGPISDRLKRAVSGGWNGLVSFFLLLIRLWPAWIILAIVLPLVNRYYRKRKK